ncbi:acyl-CoA synthetase, partial [Acinetobacter baumannii]
TVAFILEHSEARVLLADREFSRTVARALGQVASPPIVIDIDDPAFEGGELLGNQDYEAFIASGDPDHAWEGPADEWEAIAVNYTPSATSR